MEIVSSPEKERGRELTPKVFTKLLDQLSPDPEIAGIEYEELRRRLIKFFEWRGSLFPEDLADETLNRTARKIDGGEEIEKTSSPWRWGLRTSYFWKHRGVRTTDGRRWKN